MFNITTVVFDGTSPAFYFTNTSGWNTSSSYDTSSHFFLSNFGIVVENISLMFPSTLLPSRCLWVEGMWKFVLTNRKENNFFFFKNHFKNVPILTRSDVSMNLKTLQFLLHFPCFGAYRRNSVIYSVTVFGNNLYQYKLKFCYSYLPDITYHFN